MTHKLRLTLLIVRQVAVTKMRRAPLLNGRSRAITRARARRSCRR